VDQERFRKSRIFREYCKCSFRDSIGVFLGSNHFWQLLEYAKGKLAFGLISCLSISVSFHSHPISQFSFHPLTFVSHILDMVFSKLKCVVSRNLTSDPPQCSQEWQVTFLLPVRWVAGCLSTLISRLGARISYGKLLEKGFDKGESKRERGLYRCPPPPLPYTACSRITASLSRLLWVGERTRKELHDESRRRRCEIQNCKVRKAFPCFSSLVWFATTRDSLLLKYLQFIKTEDTTSCCVLNLLQ
jgi:hypothetical protein